MSRIEGLVARQITIPLDQPLRLGGATIQKRDYCMVEVITDEGRRGLSLGFTRGADLAGIVIDTLSPILLGADSHAIEDIWLTCYRQTRLIGRQGAIMRAISLVDIALWDLKSREAHFPLYKLLGGAARPIPVLMAGGYYAEGKGLDQLVEEYQAYLEEGYRFLKLMVGGDSMAGDLARYVAVRKAMPANVSLAVDANGSWSDPKAVLRWIDQAQDATGLPLDFLEEPLPPEQKEGNNFIGERTTVPLAIGEFLGGRWEFRDWIASGGIDILRADATACGGLTEWKRISALADAWNLRKIPHYWPSIHLHCALAFHGCENIEVVSEKNKNSSGHMIIGRSYAITNGMAYPLERDGLGLEIDSGAVERYTTLKRVAGKG